MRIFHGEPMLHTYFMHRYFLCHGLATDQASHFFNGNHLYRQDQDK